MKKLLMIFAVIMALCCAGGTALCETETIVVSDGDIQATFILDAETAYIGQPFTVQYELRGGSGEFKDVTFQAVFGRGSGMCDHGYTEKLSGESGKVVMIPDEGKTISILIRGYDTSGQQFYLEMGKDIPLLPNPDVPVIIDLDRTAVIAGETVTASYEIGGCSSFTGTLSWTLFDKGEDWSSTSEKLDEQMVSGTSGTVSFTPSFGDKLWLVLKGQDDKGRFVYVESEAIQISADVLVPPAIPGDTSGDGVVDIMDALLILQYSVDRNVTLNLESADVDGSDTVDIMDALLILQYDAGWNVTLE